MNAMQAQVGIVGNCKPLRKVLSRALRAASTNLAVLIEGETGTGKELLARCIHAHSGDRALRPFVAVNCAAIPKDLFESEMFGHERGAFTGAVATKIGAFERADGGTLFLDEIGELPLDQQAKLLRVLQEREVQRVGGAAQRRVDARIITASHRDLRTAGFREDLYFRVAVCTLRLAPLRERGRDIIAIASQLLAREFPTKTLSRSARRLLLAHEWPGNIRELENVLRAAALDTEGTRIGEAVLRSQPTFAGVEEKRDRTSLVRSFLNVHSRITAADVRELLGVQRAQASRLLTEWERGGLLVRCGAGVATYYVATSQSHLSVVR